MFFGAIQLRSAGSPQQPIVIGAYGEGEKPVISGLLELNDWIGVGNGIFKSKGDSLTAKSNLLMIDGASQEMGRYPNQGFLTYRTVKGEPNALSADQDMSALNPLGGTVVIRKNQWIIDRHQIEAVNGNKIVFSAGGYNLTDEYGFFIQNHLSTLDSFGEWYHDTSKNEFYVFLGSSADPYNIKVSALEHLVMNSSKGRDIVIENLHFKGANRSSIQLVGSEGIQLIGCKVEFSGENALTAMDVPRLTIENNEISFSNNSGLFLRYGTPHATIRNNLIENTHLHVGMGLNGDGNGMAIHSVSDDAKIEGNRIFNTGYSGIVFNGNRTLVANNYINSFCLVKNDGGGIYVYEGSRNREFTGLRISGNIIVNGIGTKDGARMNSKFSKPQVEGIYLDDNSSGIEVTENSVANMSRNAISLHNARNIVLKRNTVFNGSTQLSISHDELGDPIRNVTVSDNLFVASQRSQKIMVLSSTSDDLLQMAVFVNNTYVFPKGNSYVFQATERNGQGNVHSRNLSFQQWKDSFAIDHNSQAIEMEGYHHLVEKKADKFYTQIDPASKNVSCLDEDCNLSARASSSLGDDGITATISKAGSGLKINLGAIDPLSQYVLRLHLTAHSSLTLSCSLRHNGHPWSSIYEPSVFNINPTTTLIEKVFSFPDKSDKAAIILMVENEKGSFNLNKVEWFEADVSTTYPQFLFQYNPTGEALIFDVPNGYSVIQGGSVGEQLTIPPYTSILLFK